MPLTTAQSGMARFINRTVNREITYSTPNPWERIQAGENALGDCKAYSTTKYDRLIDYGISKDDLYLCEVAVNSSIRNHAVVMVLEQEGPFILTNGIDAVLPISSAEFAGWTQWARFMHNTGVLEEFEVEKS